MPKTQLHQISQPKNKMLSNLHPAILLAKIITVSATTSNPGQVEAWEVILWKKATGVFATTGVMPERNQQINAGTGMAINTDMDRDMDMGNAGDGKSYSVSCSARKINKNIKKAHTWFH